MSITSTVKKKRKSSDNFIVPWKHGNILLSQISSFSVYALFRKFFTPPPPLPDSEPGTLLLLIKVLKI